MISNRYLKTESSSLVDSIIEMKVENLPKFSEIEVVAKTNSSFYCINAPMNLSKNTVWTSKNKYIADMNGIVNLNSTPPISGYYKGAFPMGCISFMKPIITKKIIKKYKDIEDISLNDSYGIEISIYLSDKLIDTKVIERRFLKKDISLEEVHSKYYEARYFCKKNQASLPAIMVVSGSEGGIEKAQCIAQLLANHGYATLAIAYFGLNSISEHLSEIPLECVQEAIRYLKNKKEVNPERIGIYGRSKGAELALLSANYFNDIRCTVLNSPTNLVFEGINKRLPSKTSSWTFKNKQISYFRFNFINFLYSKIKNEIYPNLVNEIGNDCEIPIHNIKSNILCLTATDDEIWDSYKSTIQINKRFNEMEFDYNFEYQFFMNSGHMMTVPFIANNRYPKMNEVSVMNDTLDSWKATLLFFNKYL